MSINKPDMNFFDMKGKGSKLIYEIKVVGEVWIRVSTEEFNAWSGLKRILCEEDLKQSDGRK